mgnify:CR=1 FL=1
MNKDESLTLHARQSLFISESYLENLILENSPLNKIKVVLKTIFKSNIKLQFLK